MTDARDDRRDDPPAADPAGADVPRSWADAQAEQDRFESLLDEEEGDWQQATDDLARGKEPEDGSAGLSNPA